MAAGKRATTASERTQAIMVRLMALPAAAQDHYYLYRMENGKASLYDYIIHGPA